MSFTNLSKALMLSVLFISPILSFAAQVERTVWGAAESPFVRKLLVVLEEKHLKYDTKEVLPAVVLSKLKQDVPLEFKAISPLGKIPAFQEKVNGSTFAISDSNVIVNYLEQKYPTPALRPKSIEQNAWVSWFMSYADEILAPSAQRILLERVIKVHLFKESGDEAVVKKILTQDLPTVLDFLETNLEKKPWIAGTDNISLADIAIVSQFVSLQFSQVDLKELITERRPHLLAYVNKILARPSFQKVNALLK